MPEGPYVKVGTIIGLFAPGRFLSHSGRLDPLAAVQCNGVEEEQWIKQ